LGWEVIVAADGNDGTRERVAAMARSSEWAGRLSLLGTAERGGKGKGIRNAVRAARGRYIGFVDADYKTPIDEFDKLLPPLKAGCDVVIGSRAVGDSRIIRPQPLYRRWGSTAFKWVMRAIVGLYGIGDTQCGFKFFQGRVAKDLFARQRIDGYMFDVEILRLARKVGYSIREVGVRWQDDGDSRYDPVAGTWRNAKELLRIRFMQYPPVSRGGGVVVFANDSDADDSTGSDAAVRVQKPALTHS
jgi:dolichyl-phosphate beta-glucosyltransferase